MESKDVSIPFPPNETTPNSKLSKMDSDEMMSDDVKDEKVVMNIHSDDLPKMKVFNSTSARLTRAEDLNSGDLVIQKELLMEVLELQESKDFDT